MRGAAQGGAARGAQRLRVFGQLLVERKSEGEDEGGAEAQAAQAEAQAAVAAAQAAVAAAEALLVFVDLGRRT